MKNETLSILLVEDDLLTQKTNRRILSRFGEVTCASTFQEAKILLNKRTFEVAFFDLNLNGHLHGLNLISIAEEKNLYSIVLSGESGKEILETAFKNGAKDYLLKPFNDEKLEAVMSRFLNGRKHIHFENIINQNYITKSRRQTEELYKIKNLTIYDRPIFISGETGTGKRVVAHILKQVMGKENFIELNCSQYTDELIASELFGHVKGAFTGATSDKEGILAKANGGILFLDEIHGLSPQQQKALLKAIEEKKFYPVGSSKPVESNFRLFSATCENIQDLIKEGKFRGDLFARISTFQINLLPLRERPEDIQVLFEHFISKHLVQILINDEALEILKRYSWPRNTRELEDLVVNWIVDGHRLITSEHLPTHIVANTPDIKKFIPDLYLDLVEDNGLTEFLAFLKKEIIQEMIKRHGSLRKASEMMGSSHTNISAFLKQKTNLNLIGGANERN